MLTANEIEAYAEKITERNYDEEVTGLLIDDLSSDDRGAVLIRVSEIIAATVKRKFPGAVMG